MFGWLFGKKRYIKLEEDTKRSFSSVKEDIDAVGKWIKHLDEQDKQLSDTVSAVMGELSTIKDEIASLHESVDLMNEERKNKQLFENSGVSTKQPGVWGVQTAVQTTVQTGNFYEILQGLSSNERMIVFTLANSDMKLSYEDLAMLLGKERSTIRGHINRIKQKSVGIIEEFAEKNGKKRLFVPDELKEKLAKYAKVRGRRSEKEKE